MSAEQESRLRDAAATAADQHRFTATLHADADLTSSWVDVLLDGLDCGKQGGSAGDAEAGRDGAQALREYTQHQWDGQTESNPRDRLARLE